MSDSKTAVSTSDIINLNSAITLLILELQTLVSQLELITEISPKPGETL